jgi:serine protease Do
LTVAVDYVVPGSPAAKGGIRAGDVIVKFDGLPFYSAAELRRRITGASPNDAIAVTLVRGGVLNQENVVAGRQPATPPFLPGESEWGIRLLGQLSAEESGRLIVDGREGVAVWDVEPHGKGRDLFPRDVIRSVNDVATPNLEVFCREVTRLLESPSREKVRLLVSSQGATRSVEIGKK